MRSLVSSTAPTDPGSEISKYKMDSYTMARATLSGVIGPVLTEIHKSSVLAEFFFFFVSDLAVAMASLQQQQQQLLAWRQQQQWQHTTKAVRSTSRGRVRRTTRQTVLKTPWSCLSVVKLQSWLKKSWMLSVLPSMAFGYGAVTPVN